MHKISQENAQVRALCLRLLSGNSWVGAFIQSTATLLLTLMDPARRGQVQIEAISTWELLLFSPFEFSITFQNNLLMIFFRVSKNCTSKKKKGNKKNFKINFKICKFMKDFFALLLLFFVSFHRHEEKEEQVTHRDAHPQIKNLLLLSSYIVYLWRLPLAKAKQAIEAKDKNKLHLRAGAHKLSRALGKCGR